MAGPKPVEVKNSEAIPVVVSGVPESADIVRPDGPRAFEADNEAKVVATKAENEAKVIAAKAATDEGSLTKEDQRRISGVWERTQQIIAISVVEVTLVVSAILVSTPGVATLFGLPVPESATAIASTGLVFLASIANLVIGFYFGRTNHQRVGGGETR